MKHAIGHSPWEARYGYCRAIKAGPYIHVSGTTATDPEGNVVFPDDVEGQTRYIFELIAQALEQFGASLEHVVRTRSFITDITHHDAFGRAHLEAVGSAKPAATLVEVQALISPEHLIEIEVDAYLPE